MCVHCVQMPEAAEVFTVRLVTASGAAALSPSDTQTSLTVAQNDDPISFTRSFVQAAEGEVAEFMVARGGQAIGTSCDSLSHSLPPLFPILPHFPHFFPTLPHSLPFLPHFLL